MGIKMADCVKLHKCIPEVKSHIQGIDSSVLSKRGENPIIEAANNPVSRKEVEGSITSVAENIFQPVSSGSSSSSQRSRVLSPSSVNSSSEVTSFSSPAYPGDVVYKCSARDVLTASDAGRKAISEYESTGMVIKHKNSMIQLLVADMTSKCGTLYPASTAKANLAATLITDFPGLRGIGTLGYEQYYSPYRQIVLPGTNKVKKITPHGHIEERLKTIRKREGVRLQTKRPRMDPPEEPLETSAPFSEEERIMINELRFHNIGLERQAEIMEVTFQSRRKWILKSRPTFSEVCGRFQPLSELQSAFQKEFMRWCPEAADFLVQWEDISPKVLLYAAKKSNPMVKIILDEVKEFSPCPQSVEMEYAVHLLPYILTVPLRKTKRFSADEVAGHFIHISPNVVSMETILERLQQENKQHPMLVGIGRRGAIEQVFVTVEGQAIEIKRGGLLFALDQLMKLYFVMQMAYPSECSHVLQFLQYAVLGVKDGIEMTCRSTLDLAQFVKSIR